MATKPKGSPTKAAATSQSPNQPKDLTDPDLDPETANESGEATEDEEPVSDVDESTPPVDNDHVEPGSELFDSPAKASAPAGPGSVGSASGQGSSIDPVTGEPASPVAGSAVGVEPAPVPQKRHMRDRIKDVETRWGKDFEEILLDLHDHVFGTSDPHEVTTAKRKQAADEASVTAE